MLSIMAFRNEIKEITEQHREVGAELMGISSF